MSRNYRPLAIFTGIALLAICICVSAYWLSDAQVTQAAMENGYQQVEVDGELVWRKRPIEKFAKAVKWLIEIAVEFF
jgi:hypothetical protein